jgi:hypothetical protein
MGIDLFLVAGIVLCAFGLWGWGLPMIAFAVWIGWPR